MPYIKANDGRREALEKGESALTAGELNYQIFWHVKHPRVFNKVKEIKRFVDQFLGEKPNYQKYNDMTGCLVRCAKELKRRLQIYDGILDSLMIIMDSYDDEIAKYEDTKIKENGDVE